jgi:hypothetical protein
MPASALIPVAFDAEKGENTVKSKNPIVPATKNAAPNETPFRIHIGAPPFRSSLAVLYRVR